MNKLKVYFIPEASEDLKKLSSNLQRKILNKIDWLASNIERIKLIPLYGKFAGFYKLRFGDYRVLYKVDWLKGSIIIYVIKHRKEVYR